MEAAVEVKHNGDLGHATLPQNTPIQSTNSGVVRGLADHKESDPSRLAIEYRPLADLIPYARNARTHSEAQVAQIAASILEFGWTNPVLVDGDNGIIAGHGRVLAARKLGIVDVPVIELAVSAKRRCAYILADNKLALNAGWDVEMLGLELADLDALGVDLSLTGFGEDEILSLTSRGMPGLTDPDDVPELTDQATTLSGDVWMLGKHRLLCGNSTNAADVESALAGVKPHLLVSDPPYGVSFDPSWREGLAAGTELARGKVLNDDRADWREAWALFPGDVAYVWHGALHAATVAASLESSGFAVRSQTSWTRRVLSSAAAIITGNTSPPGTPSARAGKVTGPATASRPRSGPFRTASRKPATAHKSRSNA